MDVRARLLPRWRGELGSGGNLVSRGRRACAQRLFPPRSVGPHDCGSDESAGRRSPHHRAGCGRVLVLGARGMPGGGRNTFGPGGRSAPFRLAGGPQSPAAGRLPAGTARGGRSRDPHRSAAFAALAGSRASGAGAGRPRDWLGRGGRTQHPAPSADRGETGSSRDRPECSSATELSVISPNRLTRSRGERGENRPGESGSTGRACGRGTEIGLRELRASPETGLVPGAGRIQTSAAGVQSGGDGAPPSKGWPFQTPAQKLAVLRSMTTSASSAVLVPPGCRTHCRSGWRLSHGRN
jgi:hypothetical protein